MATTLVVLLLCSGALVAYEVFTYRRLWVSDLTAEADLLAHASAPSIVSGDLTSAEENLRLARLQPRVLAAALYLPDGRKFVEETADEAVRAPDRLDAGMMQARSRFGVSEIEIVDPVLRDDEIVGFVYLRAGHDLSTRIAGYCGIVFGIASIGFLLSYFVFRRLQESVTRPLERIGAVARDVAATRNWSLRAPTTEYEDVGALVEAFNAMLSEIQSRTEKLDIEVIERIRAEQELRQADRRKDQFIATLGHELRNPLAPMTNAVTLLGAPTTSRAGREKALHILDRQLGRMARLIDDLLDVSRVSTGKLSLHLERVELTALLSDAVDVVEPTVLQKDLALVWKPEGRPVYVKGDPARLSQVFLNLLANACRYTPAGGRVDVTLELVDGSVEVSVRDTGIGIDPALQGRIFDLFVQADTSLERGNTGLGVGLSLARQLVGLHGGEIRVSSEGVGRGSCFTVRLPLDASSQPGSTVPVAGEASRSSLPASPVSILVADDNVDFASSLAEVLAAAGYVVRVAHDGAQALKAAVEAVPRIAILDIGMPKLNGYDLARALRANPVTSGIKLIAITGWGQESDKVQAREAGFDLHLVKPVDPDVLMDAVQEMATSLPAEADARFTGSGGATA